MTLHARTIGDPLQVLPIVQAEIRALDSALPLFHVQTMDARVDDSLRQERLVATLSAVLSLLGTLVAADWALRASSTSRLFSARARSAFGLRSAPSLGRSC